MAYDSTLGDRLCDLLDHDPQIEVKKMFGGLCFLFKGNMLCGIIGDQMMARVGPEQYENCLQQEHAKEMDFMGKAMKGMVYISPEGIEEDDDLDKWLERCKEFVEPMPLKVKKVNNIKKG